VGQGRRRVGALPDVMRRILAICAISFEAALGTPYANATQRSGRSNRFMDGRIAMRSLTMFFVALLVYAAVTEMPTPEGFTEPGVATATSNAP